MAMTKKERSKVEDAMLVAAAIETGSRLYKKAKPVVKKIISKAKDIYKKHKDKREYKNNNYEEGK